MDKVLGIRKSAKRGRAKLAQQKAEQTQTAKKSQGKKCKQRNANKVLGMRVFNKSKAKTVSLWWPFLYGK